MEVDIEHVRNVSELKQYIEELKGDLELELITNGKSVMAVVLIGSLKAALADLETLKRGITK